MAITINTKSYAANKYQGNSVAYVGPNNSPLSQDKVFMSVNETPERADYSGDVRATVRFVRTLTLTGAKTPTGMAYVDVPVKIPRGAASADIDALLNDAGAFLSSADGKTFVKSQKNSW
nr:MAG: coat protein [Leviviridae sp.]